MYKKATKARKLLIKIVDATLKIRDNWKQGMDTKRAQRLRNF